MATFICSKDVEYLYEMIYIRLNILFRITVATVGDSEIALSILRYIATELHVHCHVLCPKTT